MTAWKKWEDDCARQLGGRRVLGNRGSGVPDSDEDTPLALECKLGFNRYQLRDAWLEQARRNATASGKPWAIVQRPKHARRAVATVDWLFLVELCQRAGLVKEIDVRADGDAA